MLIVGMKNKTCTYFSRSPSGQQSDLAACGSAASRSDILRVFEKNTLVSDEFPEPVAVFARIAIDVSNSRKFLTVRLADVEHVRGPEPDSG
jgi:hypothetical protein